MAKVRIALDLDGVVYDWGGTVRYLLRTHHGIVLPPSPHWAYVQEAIPKEVWRWLWNEGIDLGLFQYGHHLTGSVDGIRALAKLGSLEVVTHRPRKSLRATLHFVANLPDVFSGFHFLTDQEPKSSVGCDLYIDDAPHVIREVTAAGREAIIFDQPWNQEAELDRLAIRARGWEEVVEIAGEVVPFIQANKRRKS